MSIPLTDAELRALIVTEVGDYNGIVAANIDLIWRLYGSFAPFDPLQYLLSKRHAVTMLAGQVWQMVNALVDDTREWLSDMHTHLMNMLKDLDAEIDAAFAQATVMMGAAVAGGTILAVTPTVPPAGAPDANSPVYLGNPYSPRIVRVS